MALTAPNIRRNIAQSADNIYINRWWTGEITNRSPLFTPVSSLGLQIISRHDTLNGGLNMEVSPTMTLVRRYGHSKACSQAFGSNDWPLNWSSFKNTSGVIALLVDTPTMVATFNGTTITSLYSKGTTVESSFQKVGSMVYVCDGTNQKKWDQTTVRNWGIAAPAVNPGVSSGAGSLSPTSGYQWVYCYKCSATGHYSTASAPTGNLGPLSNVQYTVTYTASADPQVDTISIFRTADGGSLYYWVADVANATSSYIDNNPDSSLNTQIIAPIAHSNDAPPSGLSLVTWHQDRLVGASGNFLYFSAGPDTITGIPEECWPPANVFKLPGTITALASTTNGLLVWTSSDMFVMLGTSTADFWVKPLHNHYGVLSQNCVAQEGDMVFFYTSTTQLYRLDSEGLDEIGFNVGDQLATTFSPVNTYLAIHKYGLDVALWLSDGSANLKGYNLRFGCWMPTGQPVNGVGAIKSLETAPGVYSLMVGRAVGSGYILKRDTSTYQDDGSSYACNSVVGSLDVAPPGELSKVEKVLLQVMPVGSYPTLSVSCNEITDNFTVLPNPVDDPPQKAGTQFASHTIWTKRHLLAAGQTQVPRLINYITIKIVFPAENYRAEILGLGIG